MDRLDSILLEAWNRVGARVRGNRVSALKRSRRRLKGVLTRPMREWCLVIRSCDTRITPGKAGIGFDEDAGAWALEHGEPHVLTLTGGLIRELTKPVEIAWPGVTYEEAARLCGREYKTFKGWMTRGACFETEYRREFAFPEGNQRVGRKTEMVGLGRNRLPARPVRPDQDDVANPQKTTRAARRKFVARSLPGPDWEEASRAWKYRGIGGGRPYVWTRSPIDVNNFSGRAPHAVWGTMWQWQWEKMPLEYELVVKRVPKMRKFRGKRCFRGWDFVCPGRVNELGERKECGRRCSYLYGPQRVWTLARAIGLEEGFEVGDAPGNVPSARSATRGVARAAPGEQHSLCPGLGLKVVGEWYPGLSDPIRDAAGGQMMFACKTCWGVRSACMANYNGWNEFVAQVSGGLLYGRDVPRPVEICPVVRKKREYKWKKAHPCKGRAEGVDGMKRAASH